MKQELNEKLDEAIAEAEDALETLEPGSKEMASAVSDLATLYRMRADQEKAENDSAEKFVRQEAESKLEQQKIAESRIDRWVKVGTTVFEVSLPLIVYSALTRVGFKFEETGAVSSTFFRNLLNKFKPTK